MKRRWQQDKWKAAVFTVEAAVIVPMVTIMIALLIGFIFFMHENTVSSAISYEAEFYAAQKTVNEEKPEARLQERLEQRKGEISLGFGEYSFVPSTDRQAYSVQVTGEILPGVFKGLFRRNRLVRIERVDPVFVKRIMWVGSRLTGE